MTTDRRHPVQSRFADNRVLQALVAWLVGLWLLTAIAPFNRFDWLLENLLVFIYGALLVATYRRFQFSNLSYALFALFLSLHLVGAHYTYAETPFGFWLQDQLDLSRNHYDRIVHFAFGLLLAYGVMWPENRIFLIFLPIPIKAKWFVLIYGGIELLLGFTRTMPGIAHFAHLGGMIFGAVLLYRWGWRLGKTWHR